MGIQSKNKQTNIIGFSFESSWWNLLKTYKPFNSQKWLTWNFSLEYP